MHPLTVTLIVGAAIAVICLVYAVIATRKRIAQLDEEVREWGTTPVTSIRTGGVPVIVEAVSEIFTEPEGAPADAFVRPVDPVAMPRLGALVARHREDGTRIQPIESGVRPTLCASGALLVEEATDRVLTRARRQLPADQILRLRLEWVSAGVRIIAELPRGIEPGFYERWIARDRLVPAT